MPDPKDFFGRDSEHTYVKGYVRRKYRKPSFVHPFLILLFIGLLSWLLYKFWVIATIIAVMATAIYITTRWKGWKRKRLLSKVARLERQERDQATENYAQARLLELKARRNKHG